MKKLMVVFLFFLIFAFACSGVFSSSVSAGEKNEYLDGVVSSHLNLQATLKVVSDVSSIMGARHFEVKEKGHYGRVFQWPFNPGDENVFSFCEDVLPKKGEVFNLTIFKVIVNVVNGGKVVGKKNLKYIFYTKNSAPKTLNEAFKVVAW